MNRTGFVLLATFLTAVAVLALMANHYRMAAQGYKNQRDSLEQALALANNTIHDMQVRQRQVATLDAKYSGELQDAKSQIDHLRRDVATGRRRLQLRATCATSAAAGTARLDDAIGPRLTDAAEQDYFRLRDGISIVTKQLNGLQDYVRTVCLR